MTRIAGKEVPQVVLGKDSGRYIVINVVTAVTSQDDVVRGGERESYPFHVDILRAFKNEELVQGEYVECVGGGFYMLNSKKKEIVLWKYSDAFGREPDREQIASIIREAYPGWNVWIYESK